MEPPTLKVSKGERLLPLDAQRGLIMILMALDHASYFIAKVHPEEFWGNPLPQYDHILPFLTRFITHLCAPGFFFLMGISMILFNESRRAAGWPEGKITRYFMFRGFLLVILQILIENPAWAIVTIGATSAKITVPGGGTPFWLLHFGVLYALGVSMMIWSLFLHSHSLFVAAVSLGSVLATQILIPSPERAGILYPVLMRLLLIPGQTGSWQVYYPVIPWLGLTGLGMIFGRELLRDRDRAYRLGAISGIALLLLFIMVRRIGGFGNFHSPRRSDLIDFFNVTKYPPSLAYILFTLGLNLLLLTAMTKVEHELEKWGKPLLVFGRTALFFYLAHFYIYGLIGLAFPKGLSILLMYPWFVVGLLLLYPLCIWYGNFKRKTPPTSVWRFF